MVINRHSVLVSGFGGGFGLVHTTLMTVAIISKLYTSGELYERPYNKVLSAAPSVWQPSRVAISRSTKRGWIHSRNGCSRP